MLPLHVPSSLSNGGRREDNGKGRSCRTVLTRSGVVAETEKHNSKTV